MGDIKGDTRSLDYSSYGVKVPLVSSNSHGRASQGQRDYGSCTKEDGREPRD